MKVDIYHLYHSGVAVEFEDNLFVFDYYKDSPSRGSKGIKAGIIDSDYLIDKNVYVFVSHSHYDHFNPVIFNWLENNDSINYILSSDVKTNKQINNLYQMEKDQELKLAAVKVRTLGSTDRGVSFLVKIADFNIFHSGDLNWWHWSSFSAKELKKEEVDYKQEVDKLKGQEVDIAFVPVDPRLREHYYLAGDYFINTLKPKLFIPLHFQDRFSITEKFADKMKNLPDLQTRIAIINKPGEKIGYEL